MTREGRVKKRGPWRQGMNTNLGIRVGAVKLRQIGAGLLKAKLYAH
jgi:hypothetical protein